MKDKNIVAITEQTDDTRSHGGLYQLYLNTGPIVDLI